MEPITVHGTKYYPGKNAIGEKRLFIEGDHSGFDGEQVNGRFQCKLNAINANALRGRIPWLKPEPLGLKTSFGFGDRLGFATPGHIAAVTGTGIAPIFAQQSVRENERTGRTPRIVLDDAMWAVFEANWQDPWGADADHVKEIADLAPFLSAGYTFYTIDPNLHVDNDAHTDSLETLKQKVNALPWEPLETSLEKLRASYLENPITLGNLTLEFSEEELFRALGKYGRAIAHVKTLADHLVENLDSFDLEVSVDETDTPTTVKEHYFIAAELRRLEVPFISLAPRFIGRFEKGVDYIGDLAAFESELENHAGVMHAIGGYKLSIHTGSDKFSIYPVIAKSARNLVHVKTAGTSYLEALKVIAVTDIPLFREIYDLAYRCYETDRATYHVSGKLENVPLPAALKESELLGLFEQFDARQVLHVTFGSALKEYGGEIKAAIKENAGRYEEFLEEHFRRHLAAFVISK